MLDDDILAETPMAALSSLRTSGDVLGAAPFASARTPYALTTVETAQARVAVWQSRAEGLPLVFLHAGSTCKDVFAAQLQGPLRYTHRPMAIDLPGHGASSDARDPDVAYTLNGYADAVVEVLEHFDLDQAVLVGWALGGHVALNVMARYPGIVGAMLIATRPLGESAPIDAGSPTAGLLGQDTLDEAQVARLAAATVGADLADLAIPAIRRTHGATRSVLAASLAAGTFEDERRIARTSVAPIVIVEGTEDPSLGGSADRSELGNPWGRGCHVLPGGPAPFIDSPRLFDELLERFAGDMDARAAELRAHPTLVYGG